MNYKKKTKIVLLITLLLAVVITVSAFAFGAQWPGFSLRKPSYITIQLPDEKIFNISAEDMKALILNELNNPETDIFIYSSESIELETDYTLRFSSFEVLVSERDKNGNLVRRVYQIRISPENNIMTVNHRDYAAFLRKNIPLSEVNFDALADGSDEQARFGAFSAGGYPVTPFFYLYDIDKDEMPELIYIDVATGYDGDVYTYKNGSISEVGSIEFYPFGSLGIPLDKAEGIYCDIGYKGKYGEIYLYTIDSGILTRRLVLEYNNQPETPPDAPYAFDNFALMDYFEVIEINIEKVIYE